MFRAPILVAAIVLAACQQGGTASRSAPQPPDDPVEIGKRLLAADQPEMALASFQRALATGDVSSDALVGVAVASLKLGRRKDARVFLRAAIDADPNSAVARNNLGVLLLDDGDYAGALSEFQLAFALTDGADRAIATNLAMAEHAHQVALGSQPELDAAEFDVIQYGHGVFRLEPRAAAAPVENGETKS